MDPMVAISEVTTISLSKSTKERLRQLAEKGETYEDVVLKLIAKAAMKALDDRWNRILRQEDFSPLEDIG